MSWLKKVKSPLKLSDLLKTLDSIDIKLASLKCLQSCSSANGAHTLTVIMSLGTCTRKLGIKNEQK